MKEKLTAELLQDHKNWLENNGEKPDLRGADLSNADLYRANLSNANLRGADLSNANLCWADLSNADLRGATNLSNADLRGVNLSNADLRGVNLSNADLSGVNLSNADLRGVNLSNADLRGANLSGCKGLLSPINWMGKFETDKKGILVYKAIGNTTYSPSELWNIKPNSILEEVCNPNRTDDCGCGVNFGTLECVEDNYKESTIWLCRIEWKDLPGVVVPYNTDGKARCERLMLIKQEDK